MRRLATLAVLGMLGTALLVSSAYAQTQALGKDGSKDYNQQGTKILYQTSADSVMKLVKDSQPLPVTDADRDRDYSQVRNMIGPVTSIGPGNTTTSTAAVALGEYASLLVMVSWNTAAAADSDSVAFGLTFIGKLSTDVNDGYDFLVGAVGDTAARFARIDTASVWNTSQWKAPTVFVIAAGKPRVVTAGPPAYSLKPTSVSGPKAYYVPGSRTVYSDGRNGACFVLRDPSGAALKFSHLMVAVSNYAGTITYTNVKVDVWPKVN